MIKEKSDLLRDTGEKKKAVVVVGVKDDFQPIWHVSERKVKNDIEQILREIKDEDNELVGEVEEVFRPGKHVEGAHRPIKIRFRSQVVAEDQVLLTSGATMSHCQHQ